MDGLSPVAPLPESRARTVRSPIIDQLIFDMIADRQPLSQICESIGVPERTVRYWKLNDPEFAKGYEEARNVGFDKLAAEALTIADDRSKDTYYDSEGFARADKEWIARSRLRVDTRLKLLAVWDPARYGAKLAVQADVRTINYDVGTDVNEAAQAYRDMVEGN